MEYVSIDIETYSSRDIAKTGVYSYVEAPDFDILLLAYKFEDEEVGQLDLTADVEKNSKVWLAMKDILTDPAYIKTAFNANFERTCLSKYFGVPMPPEQWACTMVKAYTLGLPGSLDKVGEALGLAEDKKKLKTGKDLIRFFCKPCKATKTNGGRTRNMPSDNPEKWQQFCEYNQQDVVTETEIRDKLSLIQVPESEHDFWCLDQQINDHGVRLDLDIAQKIVDYDEEAQKRLKKEAANLTGLSNPNSVSQMKGWLAERGVKADSLSKDTVKDLLDGELPPDARRMLEIRQQMSKTSTKKYQTMLTAACDDSYARGLLQFYGTRTGRFAGRLIQVQNLPQNHLPDLAQARALVKAEDFDALEMLYDSVPQVLSELIRTTFIPSKGCRFVVSDFSAIEARVVAWLAGEQWTLDTFRQGGDIYCATASKMFGVPVEKHGINGHLRQRGKVAVLACGYGGGVGAMKHLDRSGAIAEEDYQGLVDDWRKANKMICRLWKVIEKKVVTAIETGRKQTYKAKVYDPTRAAHNEEISDGDGYSPYFNMRDGQDLRFQIKHKDGMKFLIVWLPSGRFISYADPGLEEGQYGPQVTYQGLNQTTRKWEKTVTWGGKLVENIVQSIARDCLEVTMKKVAAKGYQIVMHVHDEIIVDVPKDDTDALETINGIMAEPIDWAPGLPLKGDGYETAFYRKD